MKFRIFLGIVIASSIPVLQTGIRAQGTVDSMVSRSRLNFAIPDLPAFKAIGSEPSAIMRPSTPEALSVVASSFISKSGIIIPETFATEFSPALVMFANKLTLSEYQKYNQLYNIRLSLGSSTDSTGGISAAVGLRSTIIDDGDLKNDKKMKDTLYAALSNELKLRDNLRDEYLILHNITEEQFAESTAIQQAVEKYVQEHLKAAIDTVIQNIKDKYKAEHWNAQKLDVALAAVVQSPDPQAKNAYFKAADLWITYALPVCTAGQWLIGGTARLNNDIDNDSLSFDAAVSTRLYLGANRFKGFLEMQYKHDGTLTTNSILGNGGAELNIYQCIWLDLSLGLDYDVDTKNKSLVTDFKFKYALPEHFSFF